ncbi:MAG: hypothetical protein H5U40_00585, partial [Polyangiaceae bacterium]|nr:hypothetical protein [Polyangiaceae bacterium]
MPPEYRAETPNALRTGGDPPAQAFWPGFTMVPWEVSSYGHDYATAPWALYLVVGALVLALIALAWAVLPPSRPKFEAPIDGLGMLAFGAFVFGGAYVAAPLAAWWFSDDPLFGGGEARTFIVFRRLLQLEIGWALVTAVLVFAAFVLLIRRRVEARFARGAVLVAMSALVCSSVVAGHATALVQVDCLPRFDRKGHGYLHVGRPRTVEIVVACGAQYEPPPPVEVVAAAPGEVTVRIDKTYPFVRVSRVLPLRAGAETGPRRLEIREGNEWLYVFTEVSRMTRHFVEQGRDESREEVRITVGEARIDQGLRVFPLDVRFEHASAAEHYEIIGFNGELKRFQEGVLRTL